MGVDAVAVRARIGRIRRFGLTLGDLGLQMMRG